MTKCDCRHKSPLGTCPICGMSDKGDYQDHIDRLVGAAPPLSPAQRDLITTLMRTSDSRRSEQRNPNQAVIERLAEGLGHV